jgi:hypothetical protein
VGFHEGEMIEDPDAVLASGFYEKWLKAGGSAPPFDQCIGYKKPLFLGGADDLGNLELSNLDVYWSVSSQLIRQVRGLPPGTRIGSVRLEGE